EIVLVGNREDHAPIGVLQSVGLRAFIESSDNDVAAFDEPQRTMSVRSRGTQNVLHPGTCGVNERTGASRATLSGVRRHIHEPESALPMGRRSSPTGLDGCATLLGIQGIHDHESGV